MLYLLALMIPIHPPIKSYQNSCNDPLILNSNTSEIFKQYMPNTILNTSDTSDTSSIQKQYIQILPIHAEFTGPMYWMYFDVFDVNTSSKSRIRPKYSNGRCIHVMTGGTPPVPQLVLQTVMNEDQEIQQEPET